MHTLSTFLFVQISSKCLPSSKDHCKCQDAADVFYVRMNENNRWLAQCFQPHFTWAQKISSSTVSEICEMLFGIKVDNTAKLYYYRNNKTALCFHANLMNVLKWRKLSATHHRTTTGHWCMYWSVQLILPQRYSWKTKMLNIFHRWLQLVHVCELCCCIQWPWFPTNMSCSYGLDQTETSQQCLTCTNPNKSWVCIGCLQYWDTM